MVTFERFLGVRGELDGQAEPDSGGAARDQHHLLVHGARPRWCSAPVESSWRKEDKKEACE